MKNQNISITIHDFTPFYRVSYYEVLTSEKNMENEIMEELDEQSIHPSNVDELNFEDWFSWN